MRSIEIVLASSIIAKTFDPRLIQRQRVPTVDIDHHTLLSFGDAQAAVGTSLSCVPSALV
jgi:hypothetical protein